MNYNSPELLGRLRLTAIRAIEVLFPVSPGLPKDSVHVRGVFRFTMNHPFNRVSESIVIEKKDVLPWAVVARYAHVTEAYEGQDIDRYVTIDACHYDRTHSDEVIVEVKLNQIHGTCYPHFLPPHLGTFKVQFWRGRDPYIETGSDFLYGPVRGGIDDRLLQEAIRLLEAEIAHVNSG